MKKLLFGGLLLIAMSFAVAIASQEPFVQSPIGAELHVNSSNAP